MTNAPRNGLRKLALGFMPVALLAFASVSALADSSTDNIAVSATAGAHPLVGNWQGATDAFTIFVVLESELSESELSGKACIGGKDCKVLTALRFVHRILWFQYTWTADGKQQTATARVVLLPGDKALNGGMHLTTCNCTKPLGFVKVQ